MCTRDKWLAKSHEEQHILELYAELDKMKETNIKLEKLFKAKGTQRGNTNKEVNQKSNKKNPRITAFHPMTPILGSTVQKHYPPHEEEHICPILRMNVSFNGTKDGTSSQSAGTPRLTPAASDRHQGPISTTS